jgi:hypothetical protein
MPLPIANHGDAFERLLFKANVDFDVVQELHDFLPIQTKFLEVQKRGSLGVGF